MPRPTARQSHIDRALTNVSIAYSNAAYIWPQVFPRVPVQKQSDNYFIFDKDRWFSRDAGWRAPGTRAPRSDYTLSTSSYLCAEQALAHQVPDEVVDNSDDPLTPLIRGTQYVTDQLQLQIEQDVISTIFGTTWASSATPGTLWSNDAADPFGDIETGMNTTAQAIGREPNVGVIGRGLWRYLKNHPDVLDRIKYTGGNGSPAIVALEAIAAISGLDTVLLTASIEQTAAEGATAVYAYIGGNHMALMYVASSPALDEPSAGYTFVWGANEVNRYREDQEHADVVEARMSWDTKLTATDAGYLIKAAA